MANSTLKGKLVFSPEIKKKIDWLKKNGTISIQEIMNDIHSYSWNHGEEWVENFLEEMIQEQMQKKIKLL